MKIDKLNKKLELCNQKNEAMQYTMTVSVIDKYKGIFDSELLEKVLDSNTFGNYKYIKNDQLSANVVVVIGKPGKVKPSILVNYNTFNTFDSNEIMQRVRAIESKITDIMNGVEKRENYGLKERGKK